MQQTFLNKRMLACWHVKYLLANANYIYLFMLECHYFYKHALLAQAGEIVCFHLHGVFSLNHLSPSRLYSAYIGHKMFNETFEQHYRIAGLLHNKLVNDVTTASIRRGVSPLDRLYKFITLSNSFMIRYCVISLCAGP